MHRKMKQIVIAFLLAALMMISSACAMLKFPGAANSPDAGEDLESFTILLVGAEMNLEASYEKIVRAFEKERDVKFNIIVCESSQEQAEQLEEMTLDGKMPDVILMNAYSRIDYRNLAMDGALLNLEPYMQSSAEFEYGDYYAPLLDAGYFFEGQYVMPIAFQLPLIVTSHERLARHELEFSGKNGREVVEYLTNFIDENRDEDFVKMQFSRINSNNIAFMHAALGLNMIDYETLDVLYDPADFEVLANLTKKQREDMLEKLPATARPNDIWRQHIEVTQASALRFEITGGHLGGMCWMEAMYGELSESMSIGCLPTATSTDEYAGLITAFAVVSAETKAPNIALSLLQYMTENPVMNHITSPSIVNKKTMDSFMEIPMIFEGSTLSGELKDDFRKILDNMICGIIVDMGPVNTLVSESFAPYFDNQKEFEDCMKSFEENISSYQESF